MTRKPVISPPELKRKKDTNTKTEVRRYKLITPLYGGGVGGNEADPVTVVRGTEIRGHLRFWWRATQGGRYATIDEMRKSEGVIWGAAASKNKKKELPTVVLALEKIKKGKVIKKATNYRDEKVPFGDPSSPFGYVAFPLRPEEGKKAGTVRAFVEFTLKITYANEHEDDVQAALWAWETFGGIGARTRRGFGALQCVQVDSNKINPKSIKQMETEIQKKIKIHIDGGKFPEGVPHLKQNLQFALSPQNGSPNAVEAWKHLFNKLKDFRQSRYDNQKGYPYGRSKWPEPDEIRRLTGDSAPKHQNPRSTIHKFPRGQFGLPIIFQFKKGDVRAGDPEQSTLSLAEYERLASPLIIRPLACSGDRAVGIAIILDNLPKLSKRKYVLETENNTYQVEVDLKTSEAQQISPLDGKTDILKAFLDKL